VTLVQEVHHRVKNNLQIISSLVSLQSDGVSDPAIKAALLDTVQRIQSMALVHQQLYSSDNLARIDFGEYARALCHTLRGSVAPQASVGFDTEPVEIPVERAAPCGLILNELVTNAFKHGLSRDGSCTLMVRVRATPEGFALSVEDEGPGHAPDAVRSGSMGQTLVAALVRQLRATRTVTPLHPERAAGQDPGSRVQIVVPLPAAK